MIENEAYNWFDEQVRKRKESEEEVCDEMYIRAAGSVLGKWFFSRLRDEREQAKDEISKILRYYHVNPKEVPDQVKNAEDVMEALLYPSGIMTREVKLTPGWHKDASGAMLATFVKNGKPVALIPLGRRGYWYTDPETGLSKKVKRSSEKYFSRDALVFYKPFPLRKMTVQDVLLYSLGILDKGSILAYLIAALTALAVSLLIPWQTGKLFSDVTLKGGNRALLGMAIFMLSTHFSKYLFDILEVLFLRRVSLKLHIHVESATMMRILSLPLPFFRSYSSGDLANRVRLCGNLAENCINQSFSAIIKALFTLVFISEIVTFASPLVVPAVAATCLMLIVASVSAVLQSRVSIKQMESSTREIGMGYSIVSGIRKIKSCGAEKRAFAKWGKAYTEQAGYRYDLPMFLKVNRVLVYAILILSTILIYFFAISGGIGVSEYYSFHMAYGIMSGAFIALCGVVMEAGRIPSTLEMLKPILEAEPEVSEDKPVVDRLKGEIELDNVSFQYEEDGIPVIDGLSIHIHEGEYVALVGKSGCGKSTLMKILLGFEMPKKGAVYYDKKNLRNIDLKSLRSKVGCVMQDDKLFTDDIFSNIAFSTPGLTMDEAWEAAEMAGIAEDIRSMPMKMFTQLSESANNISGGQKQRILIARALASKPRVLIFDEATSAMDNITQKQITDTLDSIKCTKVVIAQRLSTVRHCDRIIVLDGGKIREDGSFDELMEKNGFFAELVRRQTM